MYKTIFIDEFYLNEKNKNLKILDVREVDEFHNGHIPSAKNLPLSTLQNSINTLEKAEAYYVICQSGGRSSAACDFLSTLGFDVTNVMGGMAAWKGEIE